MALRILLSNDDGIFAPGLLALKKALDDEGYEVTVCAPDRPRSAASHAITLHKPLRAVETRLPDGSLGWAISGTPADCALLGLDAICAEKGIDLVLSGINHGPNLGWDVIYSGTVAAAMEAVILGFPAIAVSCTSYDKDLHYDTGARFVARELVPKVMASGLPRNTLLNVNVPNLPESEIKGVKLAAKSERRYKDRMEKRLDPRGGAYYWLGGLPTDEPTPAGTDSAVTAEGYIAVTPLHLDMTSYSLMEDMKNWF
jgi:5'-nucleotidase